MNDWRTRLRDADAMRDPLMPPDAVRRVRSIVVSAAGDRPVGGTQMWPRAFLVTATLLVLVCASVLASLQRATRHMMPAVDADGAQVATVRTADGIDAERQQLHFRTPGGTRIIWVFDSQFEVKGTLP